MSGYELTMSLAVRHPDIDPHRITRALGFKPEHVWQKGEDRVNAAGASLGSAHRASYWLCEIAPRPRFAGELTGLEGELSRVLQVLSGAAGFLQSLHEEGGATELHVSLFARGDFRLDLSPQVSSLLGHLAVTLRIDVKSHPAADEMGK